MSPELAAEVAALFAADALADPSRLERAVAAEAEGLLDDRERAASPGLAGSVLGAWKLIEPLGRGGMAEVWAAERVDGQFELRVAVKLLKRGMDSEEIVRRFARERRILARLDHPAIARVIDGGVAPDGRLFLVLERVDGGPITAWCADRALDLPSRLRLLVEVCDAVAAAHRQLVVHRDLKPSNILVTGDGRPKLLDFGIAKLLTGDEADAEATRTELRLLTPAYAAPEQILGQPVTTATDVYALGALAYELLTGRLPHAREGRLGELASQVERESLVRPSTAVGEMAEIAGLEPPAGLPEPTRLARALRGDLDAILLTALRREPERRYASVEAFAEDLRRVCDGRPVLARPDRFGYRAAKFVRRHRIAVGLGTLAAAGLATLAAIALAQAERSRANAREAEAQAARAAAVKEFLIGLFEVADPEQSGGARVTAAALVDQAGRRLEGELASAPDIQAELLESVARIEKSLGRLEPAASRAARALAIREAQPDASDAERGNALATLGSVELAQGKLDDAEKRLLAGVSLLESGQGADELAAARAQSDLAQVAFWRENLEEAERLERVAWETYRRVLGDEHVHTAIHRFNLGVVAYQRNRLEEAETAVRAAQDVLVRVLGPEHVNLANCYANLAAILESRGRTAEAEPLHRRALAIRRRELGDTHPATGRSKQLLAVLLLHDRRWDEAETLTREALELFRAIDPHHFEVGKALHGLGQIAAGRGRPAEAERYLSEATAEFRRSLGEKHPFVWMASSAVARQQAKQGRLDEAEARLREALERLRGLVDDGNEYLADVESPLGELLRQRGQLDEALALHRHAARTLAAIYGERHLKVVEARARVVADLAADPTRWDAAAAAEARAVRVLLAELDPQSAQLADLDRWLAAPVRTPA